MSLANFSAIFSSIGQLPAAAAVAAVIVMGFVFGGVGHGIGMIFRDIPKYTYKIIHDILSFILAILILKWKRKMDSPPDDNEGKNNDHAAKTFEIIEGGKTNKQGDHHKDRRAT